MSAEQARNEPCLLSSTFKHYGHWFTINIVKRLDLPVWGPTEWWEPGTGGSEAAGRNLSRTQRHLSSWRTAAARWCCSGGKGSSAGTSWHKPGRIAPFHPWWLSKRHRVGTHKRIWIRATLGNRKTTSRLVWLIIKHGKIIRQQLDVISYNLASFPSQRLANDAKLYIFLPERNSNVVYT